MFTTIPARIGLGLLGLVVLVALGFFVVRGLPHLPSAASRALPKVEAKVEKAQGQVDATTAKADTKAKAASADLQKRTETHVEKIRAAPAGVSDHEFYRSVCNTQFYAGSAECRGFRR